MLKDLLVRLGVPALARPIFGGAGCVLVFHRVRPRDPELMFEANHRNSIPPENLHAVLDTLAEQGIEVIHLDEALERLAAPRPGPFACLTFDDGYRDNHDTLLPILEARRVPATIYIAPGLIDGSAPLWWYALDQAIAREARLRLPLPDETDIPCADGDAKERAFAQTTEFMLRAAPEAARRLNDALATRYGTDPAALAARHMMTWDMVRTVAASPFVEIGAHTLSHPPLATLGPSQVTAEMQGSRDRLERETGRTVRHLAYPYGTQATTGAREMRLAAELGFRTATTTAPGNVFPRHASARHAWPRHGIGPADGTAALRLKLAGVSNPLRALRSGR